MARNSLCHYRFSTCADHQWFSAQKICFLPILATSRVPASHTTRSKQPREQSCDTEPTAKETGYENDISVVLLKMSSSWTKAYATKKEQELYCVAVAGRHSRDNASYKTVWVWDGRWTESDLLEEGSSCLCQEQRKKLCSIGQIDSSVR